MTKIKLILLASFFITSIAFACQDFEDCLNPKPKEYKLDCPACKPSIVKFIDSTNTETSALKAIAYKLDEISKKLEPSEKENKCYAKK